MSVHDHPQGEGSAARGQIRVSGSAPEREPKSISGQLSTSLTAGAEALDQLAEVDSLAEEVGASPFLRFGWIRSWWDAFGEGTFTLATVRDDGRLVGAAPLIRRRSTFRSLTNWHTPIYDLLCTSEAVRRELAELIFSSAGPRHIGLSFLDQSATTWRRCEEMARGAGRSVLARTIQKSPYIRIDGSWEEFEQARLSRNRRQYFRRYHRKLEAQGPVSFEVCDGAAELDSLLAEGFAVEASGWKGARGSAIRSDRHTVGFYTDLAYWAAERGLLRLGFLRVGSRAVAFDYGLEANDVHYMLKTGFDPSYRQFSAGMLLRYQSIRRAFEEGLRRYELLGGVEPYKMIWTDDVRESGRIQAFKRSPMGRLEHVARRRFLPIARRVLASGR